MISFYRLSKGSHGPHNHPDGRHRDACAALARIPGRPKFSTLADLTDGQPQHWRSGTTSLTALHAYFGPVLSTLLASGYRAWHWTLEEDDILTDSGDQAAAYWTSIEEPGEDVTDALTALHLREAQL